MLMMASLALIVGAAAAAPIRSVADAEDIAAIRKLEYDAVTADLAGDAGFYAALLADDWTGGMSNGEFQTKPMLLADLRDPTHNITLKETISHPDVRLYGAAAVTTYTETYEALVHGERHARTIISTNTYVKRDGKWLQVSSHSSALPIPAPRGDGE